jgi:hypothetical protein
LLVFLAARPVPDIPLQIADGDRQAFVAADALDLALGLLRADPARDGRQGVVAEKALGGLGQVALGKQFDEARDVDAHGTTANALGVAAEEAALGFEQRHLLGQTQVDLVEVSVADQGFLLRHPLPPNLEALLGSQLGRHGSSLNELNGLERLNALGL